MVWYAETTARRWWQVTADLAMVAWGWMWWRLGVATHDLVAALGGPGRTLAATSTRMEGGFRDVADAVGGTPVVGGALQSPFVELADAAAALAGVGTAQDAASAALADWVGGLVLVVPLLIVAIPWAVVRVRGARRAGGARRLRDGGGADLLALRALVGRPLGELLAVSPTPVADWRAGEVSALADLELRRLGLRSTPSRRAVDE